MWPENNQARKTSQAKGFTVEFVFGWQRAGAVPHTLLRSKVSSGDGLNTACATFVICQGEPAASVVLPPAPQCKHVHYKIPLSSSCKRIT